MLFVRCAVIGIDDNITVQICGIPVETANINQRVTKGIYLTAMMNASLIKMANPRISKLANIIVYAFVLCCLWSTSSRANEASSSYPDIWYRTYEWPVEVREILFADPEKWRDEPVVILGKDKARNAVAEGFFSKKRYALTGVYKKGKWRYHYKRDGKPLVKRYMNGQSKDWFGELPNGERLDESYEYFLSGGGIDQYPRPEDSLPAAIAGHNCEPIRT